MRPDLVREYLLDPTKCQELVKIWYDIGLAHGVYDEEHEGFQEHVRRYAREYYPIAATQIHQWCESPIEKVLLGSVMLAFLKAEPYSFVVQKLEASDPLAHIRSRHEYFATMLPFRDKPDTVREMLAAGAISEEQYGEYLLMSGGSMGDAFHFVVQPRITIGKHRYRPDCLVWVPFNPNVRLIIEADGGDHLRKRVFIADRRRDRVFHRAGFGVLRYAGTEMWHDCAAVATEIFEVLEETRESDGV